MDADELAFFVAAQGLQGSGLNFVDAHLLAAALRNEGVKLWTRDKRLAGRAALLDVGWEPA